MNVINPNRKHETAELHHTAVGNAWELETAKEISFAEELSRICNLAIEGGVYAKEILITLWNGEPWESIQVKLEVESSNWISWWNNGVRKLMNIYEDPEKKEMIDLLIKLE
jgi:hypothetical protein